MKMVTFSVRSGEQVSQNHKFKSPRALSINDNGEIIVADSGNKLIKIFSPSGEYLRNFGGASTFVTPYHCIQLGQRFIVSDWDDHSIKMFDLEGSLFQNSESRETRMESSTILFPC